MEQQGFPRNSGNGSQVQEMRDWIADCQWGEDDDALAELSDAAIVAGVERHYEGGVRQFLADA